MMKRAGYIAALVVGFVSVAPAQAQDVTQMIINDVISQTVANSVGSYQNTRCLSGQFEDSSTAAALPSAQATMEMYFNAVRAAESADVSAAYTRRRNQAVWALGDTKQSGSITAISDTIARQFMIDGAPSEPNHFFIAGDRRTAAGQWVLRNAGGDVVGTYDGVFRRERREWRLVSLYVHAGEAPALTRYCELPGDVERYLLSQQPLTEPPPQSESVLKGADAEAAAAEELAEQAVQVESTGEAPSP